MSFNSGLSVAVPKYFFPTAFATVFSSALEVAVGRLVVADTDVAPDGAVARVIGKKKEKRVQNRFIDEVCGVGAILNVEYQP